MKRNTDWQSDLAFWESAYASRDPDRIREAKQLAFTRHGCLHAHPNWWRERGPRGTCLHLDCRIERGEFKRSVWNVEFAATFRSELHHGWMRFDHNCPARRRAYAAAYWAMKRQRKFSYTLGAMVACAPTT